MVGKTLPDVLIQMQGYKVYLSQNVTSHAGRFLSCYIETTLAIRCARQYTTQYVLQYYSAEIVLRGLCSDSEAALRRLARRATVPCGCYVHSSTQRTILRYAHLKISCDARCLFLLLVLYFQFTFCTLFNFDEILKILLGKRDVIFVQLLHIQQLEFSTISERIQI